MKDRSLKFYYSKYLVTDIENMIAQCPNITNFVFSFYSGKSAGYIQLIAYGQMSMDRSKYEYSTYTETLKPFRGQALEIKGPVILSNNYISIEAMKELIGSGQDDTDLKPDYLVFTPNLDAQDHIFYTVTSYISTKDGDEAIEGDGQIVTNPSPPATMPG